jgi:hypothetical protein
VTAAAEEPLQFHLWLPSGRTLCDRRSDADARPPGEFTTICGSCVFLAAYLAQSCSDLLEDPSAGLVEPPPEESVARLTRTAWAELIDLEGLAADVRSWPPGRFVVPRTSTVVMPGTDA